MRIHHFYPRTKNIGDHFVQQGIERMIRRIRPDATFELFNVNSRGEDKAEYGLTASAVERANREADLIVVGGSNLYEGSFRWRWGVHLELAALRKLHVPLFLLGIGSGSSFDSPLHHPSARARNEIKLLNDIAAFSGARDLVTYEWLQRLGITKAKLTGDPATFIFNQPAQAIPGGHILIAMPPRRFWTSKRQLWRVHTRGRRMFKDLVSMARSLVNQGHKLVMVCNDPIDLPLAASLFNSWLPDGVVCPQTTEDYFEILKNSRVVISGRLHTAVVAFSLGIPFVLFDVDQRTRGFISTYKLERWSIPPSVFGFERRLRAAADQLLSGEDSADWKAAIERRDSMCAISMDLLAEALEAIT